jgi:hypothetical protein
METQRQIKDMVRKKYGEIALQDKETYGTSCMPKITEEIHVGFISR